MMFQKIQTPALLKYLTMSEHGIYTHRLARDHHLLHPPHKKFSLSLFQHKNALYIHPEDLKNIRDLCAKELLDISRTFSQDPLHNIQRFEVCLMKLLEASSQDFLWDQSALQTILKSCTNLIQYLLKQSERIKTKGPLLLSTYHFVGLTRFISALYTEEQLTQLIKTHFVYDCLEYLTHHLGAEKVSIDFFKQYLHFTGIDDTSLIDSRSLTLHYLERDLPLDLIIERNHELVTTIDIMSATAKWLSGLKDINKTSLYTLKLVLCPKYVMEYRLILKWLA